jgi:hypothetical protein
MRGQHVGKASTDVYLVPYHSEREDLNGCSGQYRVVEQAIAGPDPWPYDNGDDPSLFVSRVEDGRLTWGVCRQDLRNAICAPSPKRNGAIVVFFPFTKKGEDIHYRISAVATVQEKLDHRAAFTDARLIGRSYINTMIRPQNGIWNYSESDRPGRDRHAKDWLWRICDHAGFRTTEFRERYKKFYKSGVFSDLDVSEGRVRLARNYVLFSDQVDETFIVPDPPYVAKAKARVSEQWTNPCLHKLIMDKAAERGARGYLRIANPTNRNVHRQIYFKLGTHEALRWRADLIATLRKLN